MEGPDPILDPGKGFFMDVNNRIRILSYHNVSDYEAKALLVVQRKKLLPKRLMFGLVGMLTLGAYFCKTRMTDVKINTVATAITQKRVGALEEKNEMNFKILEARLAFLENIGALKEEGEMKVKVTRLALLESMKFVLGGTNIGSKYGQANGGGLPYWSPKKMRMAVEQNKDLTMFCVTVKLLRISYHVILHRV